RRLRWMPVSPRGTMNPLPIRPLDAGQGRAAQRRGHGISSVGAVMRILSGVKPTGRPHLGNYFGAIQQFVDLQNRGEGYYFIADLHALDEIRDAEKLYGLAIDVAIDYLAFGVDPKKAVMFRQSDVPEVS